MIIRFIEEAQQEFLEAVSGYEAVGTDLARRLRDEVDRCILRIADHPEMYGLRSDLYRRVNLKVFPFYIPYIVRGEVLWVLTLAHVGREPLYWVTRQRKVN